MKCLLIICRTYGTVIRAQNKQTGILYAIKMFKESDVDNHFVSSRAQLNYFIKVSQTVFREIQILNLLKPHDNIVELIEVCRQENRIYLVFEHLNRTILDEIRSH